MLGYGLYPRSCHRRRFCCKHRYLEMGFLYQPASRSRHFSSILLLVPETQRQARYLGRQETREHRLGWCLSQCRRFHPLSGCNDFLRLNLEMERGRANCALGRLWGLPYHVCYPANVQHLHHTPNAPMAYPTSAKQDHPPSLLRCCRLSCNRLRRSLLHSPFLPIHSRRYRNPGCSPTPALHLPPHLLCHGLRWPPPGNRAIHAILRPRGYVDDCGWSVNAYRRHFNIHIRNLRL